MPQPEANAAMVMAVMVMAMVDTVMVVMAMDAMAMADITEKNKKQHINLK